MADAPPPRPDAASGAHGGGEPPKKPIVPVPVRPVVPTPVKPVAAIPAKPVAPVVPAPDKPVAPVPVPPVPVPPVAVAAKPVPPVAPVPVAPVPVAPVPVAAKPVASVPAVPKPVAPKPVATRIAPTAPAGPDPYLGRTIGRLKILEKIGQGRTATVYRAHHEGLGTDVAVKILLPEILKFPEVVAKFEAEARAIARLDHPNVLKIYDVVGEGDARGIVMELLEGEDVLEYLSAEGGRVEPQDALRIVRQAAAGLQAAHAKGIIHRDVKPQNLVILEDGTVKVVDFGLATQSNSSLTAERIGTPHYMSPEACAARPAETGSDVYSLGISLFHLLTGAPPYAGQSVKGILASHAEAKPLYPEKVVRGLAPALGELVRGMTKRDPLTRTSLDEVLATIDRIGGDALVQQLRLKPKKARHHRAAAARARAKSTGPIVLVVGIAVVVGLVLLLARRGDTPPPTRTPPPTAPIEPTVPTPSPSATDPAATPPGMEEPTAPPPETPEQRNQRLAREQAEKKAACETEFREAEAFARANEGEVERIVRKYQAIAHAYPTFDLGKEARRRAEGIRKGEVHPHPDKKFAEKSAVETAKEKWTTLRAQIEAALPTKRYDEALALMPATVEDPDRKLAVELDMWRAMLHKLNGFFALLEKELASVPAAERVLETDTAKGKIARLSTAGPALVTPAGTIEVRWADVTAASIAALATRAFEGKDAALQESLACFAWAHKLRETFYGAAIAVKMGGGTGPDVDLVSTLLGRATERFPR